MQVTDVAHESNDVYKVMFVFFSETTDDEQFGKLLEKVSGNGYF